MINKDVFYKEVKGIAAKKPINKNNFDILYNVAIGNKRIKSTVELTDIILGDIFNIPCYPELLIPMKFWDTEIGKAVLQVRYDISSEEIYFVDDLVDMTGFTPQFIHKEIKSGNLKGEQRGRGKIWMFRRNDVQEYMAKKGIENPNKDEFKYETQEEIFIADDIKEDIYKV